MNPNNLIMIDVFSYSCMNCLRSLQFIKKISSRYKKYGMETVILHAHEWDFEEKSSNVINAVKKYKIKMPVIIDKNHQIIRKLGINFWPSQVLITKGKIIYKHIGEGDYMKLESAIAGFFKLKPSLFKSEPKYSRHAALYLGKLKKGKIVKTPSGLNSGTALILGRWTQNKEFLKSGSEEASLEILTKGSIVSFVAESAGKPAKISVIVDGKFIKKMTVLGPQMHELTRLKDKKTHRLIIKANAGLKIYSFSFQ